MYTNKYTKHEQTVKQTDSRLTLSWVSALHWTQKLGNCVTFGNYVTFVVFHKR